MIDPDKISAENAYKRQKRFYETGEMTVYSQLEQRLMTLDRIVSNPADMYNKTINKALKRNYVRKVGGRLELIPLVPRYTALRHLGIWDERTRKSLKDYGVWGNPSKEEPTYLSSNDWHPDDWFGGVDGWNSPGSNVEKRAVLRIDTDKLLNDRRIFIDPEALYNLPPQNEFGKTFIVLGGISKSAITRIELPYMSETERKVAMNEIRTLLI